MDPIGGNDALCPGVTVEVTVDVSTEVIVVGVKLGDRECVADIVGLELKAEVPAARTDKITKGKIPKTRKGGIAD